MEKRKVEIFLNACGLSENTSRKKGFLKEVLEYCKKSKEDSNARVLIQILNRIVKVPGFRFFELAEVNLQVQAMIPIIKRTPSLFKGIMELWANANSDLVDQALNYLLLLNDGSFESIKEKLNEDMGHDEMKSILDAFMKEHPEFDPQKSLCAFYYMALFYDYSFDSDDIYDEEEIVETLDRSIKAETDPAESASQSHGSEFWDTLTEKVKTLPADSPEWDHLPIFIQRLYDIKEKKEAERALAEARQKIEELLTKTKELMNNYPDDASLSDLQSWSSKELPDSELESLASELTMFQQQLQRCLDLHKDLQTNPLNMEIIAKFQAAVAEFNEQRNALSARFASENDSVHEPPAGMEDAVQVENETATVEDEPTADGEPTDIEHTESETNPDEVSIEYEQVHDYAPAEMDDGQTNEVETATSAEPMPVVDVSIEVDVQGASSPVVSSVITSPPATNEDHEADSPMSASEMTLENIPIETEAPIEETTQDVQAVSEQGSDATEEEETSLTDFLYDLISKDDLTGAYWLAKSLEQSGTESVIPSWLIEAMIGSRLLNWENEALSAELLEISTNQSPNDKDIDKILGLAAALKPALFSPSSGMISWLAEPDSLHEIHDIVTAFRQFAHYKFPLRPQDLTGIEDKESRKRTVETIVKEARDFITEMPKRKLERKTTTRVWGAFMSTDGPIRELLLPVVNDQKEESNRVSKLLSSWENEDNVAIQIDKELGKHIRQTRQIGAGPREQLHQYVQEACSIARKWLDATGREEVLENRGDWLFDQVKRLKDRIEASLPTVLGTLDDMGSESQPPERRAAAMALGRSMTQLAEMMKITIPAQQSNQYSSHLETWIFGSEDTLQSTLRDRLVWLPELTPQNEFILRKMKLNGLPQALQASYRDGRTLFDAVQMWLDSRDYRFIEKAIDHLDDSKTATSLRHRFREELQGARLALQEYLDAARESIEQAWVDGVLLDDERSEMLGRVEHIQPAKELNIASAHAEIKKEIQDKLANARQARLDYLKQIWTELETRLSMITDNKKVLETIGASVRAAIQDGEIRVLGESLSHLLEVIEVGKEIDETLFQRSKKPEYGKLSDFITKLPEIENFLLQSNRLQGVLRAIKGKETILSTPYSQLIKDRLDSAYEGVSAFHELGKSRNDQTRAIKNVSEILLFLGYRPFNGDSIRTDLKHKAQDVLYLRASVTAANLARPISEFGSLTEGALNVLILWERPVAETITSRIQELKLDRQGLVVFYLGRLNQTQRREILKLCRSQNITLAILDETLLVYLTRERGERLSPFLRCALPFTAVNPYKPFVQGDVPVEMFYGRKRMADSLQEYNNCLVYGGRQLGKSALLRHVQRTFHNPALERYALYIDIKNVGAAGSREANRYQGEIWERIRDGLKGLGLLKPSIHTSNADTLRKHIQECLQEKPDRRILVLFDEADNFLDADSESRDFPVLQDLKELMSNTNRRFKVVFAGLQNVQRFQGIPNQPLAQFGIPLKVGPLEPTDAARLVWEPMEFLGIEIDETTALRILSYTNYHAGLIQFFCQKLVDRIAKKQQDSKVNLPTKVQREDVEAVYREQAVRDEIRQRLDLTLQLDTRYQAITWALIEEQKSDRDGYSRSFPPKDVLDLVRDYWIAGFADTETDDMSSKLDEMCALGVLVRNADGCYRLRSPNIVALMGPNIDTRLQELANKEPEEKFRPDSHHTPLDAECREYSPLNYSQERDLTVPDSGVSMVFASSALGLSTLTDAFFRLIPQGYIDEGIGIIKDIPSDIRKSETLSDFIGATLKSYGKAEQIICLFRPQGRPETLEQLVSEALDVCKRHRSKTRKRWFKILFVIDPETAENWFLLAPEKRETIETKCDTVLSPKLWNEDGIRHRLDHMDKLPAPEVCRAIMDATGGWPYLLDHFFKTFEHENNLSGPARDFRRELFEKGSKSCGSFLKAVSLCTLPGTTEVFTVFSEMGAVDECDLPDVYQLIDHRSGKRPTQEDVLRVIDYFRRFRILRTRGIQVRLDDMVKNLYGIAG